MSAQNPIVELVDFSQIEPVAKTLWPGARRDYVSPGLVDPGLIRHFPSLEAGDVAELQWPYLRKDAPHIWRRDRRGTRNPYIGVLSLDEATLLHNNALPFRGRRGLEIGCHYAWSSAHLVAAGLDLDVIDPALGHPDQMQAVRDSLGPIGPARLWAGFSPSIVPAVRAVRPQPWSFAFIDGYHEGEAPRDDARAVLPLMADDALVMFHDLISPHVAAGLAVF
ncbi:MAG: class I SAM-dependent methyltransferase, partial [Pseudomonadota bacterium]|nr:class I SAM-dependent methyltransferase [Pseudomonadota bacterium]